jgi:hypothetical protein
MAVPTIKSPAFGETLKKLTLMLTSPLLIAVLLAAEPEKPFAIQVVDAATGRGVPLIELKTVHGVRLVTDSNGVAAFREPGLMNESIFFYVSGHGYEFPKDGFGFRGKQVKVTPGGTETLKVNRINIAERLYRVTGAGIYRDSLLVGKNVPLKQPAISGGVLGQDSVMNAVYKGKIYWFWGDTNRASYPLGNFHVPGAVSELPGKGGLDPSIGVDLTYYVDDKGFAKKTCEMPGKGPTWVESLVTLPDKDGNERLCASFVKVEPPLKIYARGLAVWNDEKQQFDKVRDIDVNAPAVPRGHAFKHRVGRQEFVYFAHPYPMTRVPATFEAFCDPAQYEGYTCVDKSGRVELNRAGTVHFSWRKGAKPLDAAQQKKLVDAGQMRPEDSPIHVRDRDTGKPVTAHGGSVYWNEYRKRWVMIFVEIYGKQSVLGEVWYAEADSPAGPWRYAVKVASHEKYSFYNPKQHPMFDQAGGRLIYFEGTYTHTFSSGPETATPRYDYNQLMCRLDLSDPRLALPRPVPGTDFLALDREIPKAVPVPTQRDKPAFYMLPDDKDAPATTVPLYEFRMGDEKRYSVLEKLEGYERSEKAVGRVWRAHAR